MKSIMSGHRKASIHIFREFFFFTKKARRKAHRLYLACLCMSIGSSCLEHWDEKNEIWAQQSRMEIDW